MWQPVIVESPYGNADPIEILLNEAYLRDALHDCLRQGEAPYASHGLYTLPGVLRDDDPEERRMGIEAGFAIGRLFPRRVFYVDRGVSVGMIKGAQEARRLNQEMITRSLSREAWRNNAKVDMTAFMTQHNLWDELPHDLALLLQLTR